MKTYIELTVNERINYKGYEELKAKRFGINQRHGRLFSLINAYDTVINSNLFLCLYRHINETKRFTGLTK